MNLIFDIGNTSTKAAIFNGSDLIARNSWKAFPKEKILAWTAEFSFDKIFAIASGKHMDNLIATFSTHSILQFDDTIELPISVLYQTPETLGKDRLAGTIGAYASHKGENVLVIDCGTCTTYNILNAEGAYMGGNITPGIALRLKAMHSNTDKLPLETVEEMEDLMGIDTATSLKTGAFGGALHEMNGWIQYYKDKYANLLIILTGGGAHMFESRLNYEIFARPNLVLEGLNEILIFNEGE